MSVINCLVDEFLDLSPNARQLHKYFWNEMKTSLATLLSFLSVFVSISVSVAIENKSVAYNHHELKMWNCGHNAFGIIPTVYEGTITLMHNASISMES